MDRKDEIKVFHDEPLASLILGEHIKDFLVERTSFHNAIIVCIGTDKCIGDCLGPLVGTILKKKKYPLEIYGTLDKPIHALNMKEKLWRIKAKHPSQLVIAVDACLGEEENIGAIQIRNGPIYPGKGVGKNLPSVGDISIIGIVDGLNHDNTISLHNIRLSFVMQMAEAIANSFVNGL